MVTQLMLIMILSIIKKLSDKQFLEVYSKHPVSENKNDSNTIILSQDQQQIFDPVKYSLYFFSFLLKMMICNSH